MENYKEVKIKELLADETIQKAIRGKVSVPQTILIKQVKKAYKNEEKNETTQKIHAISGTTLENMVELDFTLINQKLDGVEVINKYFKILDYSFAFEANMRGGNFNGYSATGLKLLVNKLEPVEGVLNNEKAKS
ncbi:hypothetical protein [Pediococcus acidilactici]|uniref:hypothetical protein n=1 Tax=Pediococcus acidilactici TaxID=1254 RepID=UPI00137C25B1|nr:hypothetical protein [Pediococcus acidilactici]QHS02491.1 hypothetical protein GWA24_01485 [Pediococcus acidilactici]